MRNTDPAHATSPQDQTKPQTVPGSNRARFIHSALLAGKTELQEGGDGYGTARDRLPRRVLGGRRRRVTGRAFRHGRNRAGFTHSVVLGGMTERQKGGDG